MNSHLTALVRDARMATPRLVLALSIVFLAVGSVSALDQPASEQATGEPADPAGITFFEKHIRPVLVENCFTCHSTQAVRVRAGLLLDSREGVAKGGEGGQILVPGQPDESRLIQAIRWEDPTFQMPPKKRLSPEQIEKFEQWVKMGAPDPRDEQSTGSERRGNEVDDA